MNYYSTNRNSKLTSLTEAVNGGLAPDGGLYMPEQIPVLPSAFFKNISEMPLKDIAYVVIDRIIGDDLDAETVRRLVNETLTFDIPLVKTNDSKIASIELFHGPTMTSKDIGARFMSRLLSSVGSCGGNNPTRIIIAGSGNSGSAVADAFAGVPNTKVTVLYPKGSVHPLQLAKIHSNPEKVLAVEVRGSYDDCLALQRTALFDTSIGDSIRIASANSVNIARILPMIPVFFHIYAKMISLGAAPESVVVSIPTGNLTALVAGILAKRMGLPIKRFIAATNSNDAVGKLISGVNEEASRKAQRTLAGELDIISPSNLPRLKDLYGNDLSAISKEIEVVSKSDEEIRMGITEAYLVDKYMVEPHGSLSYSALKQNLRTGENGVFLATVHPALYGNLIEELTGQLPKLPHGFDELPAIPKRPLSVPPVYQAARRIIQDFNS